MEQRAEILRALMEEKGMKVSDIVRISGIIKAYKAGCQNRYEIAEFLEVTEECLQECIECCRDKYGVYTTVDNYVIYFLPNLAVMEKV
ncbi:MULTISPECIES: hypothetical protein [Lachnospiraceae]|jgi:hypothetical protein|uniref:HTH cro/C1-type domain-containing protein n=1 Tax=Faecalicatena acetigenes TaxID=2981790 RepID=A0ABT2TBS0_9FIRM|nr:MULTISPECIES: hypothetical protein [Lachnospiraceae]MCU6747441.1 hypothetical protein [Faecalicatena acetigenes]RGT73330.1 hypothetical protein DWX08_06515 [Ruminococcus sp. AF18-22]SCH87599.1 Uncharacterised protein [uncultured Clostridium sp.]